MNLEVDHKIPLRHLGDEPYLHPMAWDKSNLQLLCRVCHRAKDQALRDKDKASEKEGWNRFVESLGWLDES
ncbi:MAG: HNH endonuclease [Pseudomonadales bacterium]|nr:HNH endonuclease [Pseudomonadales bacterium]